ncbi:iron chelate uptake ABC transporter family permease subunit [Desulfobacter latus]|uniref:Metal ABC transporter permease n=1 Tax=Desulfobacter latus TaxID=2292 RepID=A0A850STU3_9BACT|nr:iron chelate uptake ABC transporter family permease subunit [Desulfobacter latus]NWH03430.1 metal ABC transporter permease [Desulfobacter latus]
MLDLFYAPLTETYFQKALIGGSIIAMVAGVVGSLVVLRRMAFLGDALSHAMIAGVAGGYLFMKLAFGLEAHAPGMLLGSLIAAVTTVALISFVSRISRVKEDTAIGIMYTGIFALGVVAVSIFRHYIHIDLMHFIMGDILGVADIDLWVSAFVGAGVLSVLILFFRHFQLATFDPVMAASIGLPVVLLDYLLTTCVSLVVVSAVSMVGVILVVGLLITPAATAYLLCDRLDKMMALSALFGVTSVVGGLYLCVWLDSAGGGAIMLFCTLQFLVVLFVAPKYGLFFRWMRLRNLVPQQAVEDVLTTVLRNKKPASVDIIRKYAVQGKNLVKVLKRMTQDGLLTQQNQDYALTDKGYKEAHTVLRAHRLWESYLESIGTPETEVHSIAHRLEHLDQAQTSAYLDKKLGSPKTGPHGKEIPAKIP